MERKYTVVLCCLALLFLVGICYAGNTPWPKHSGSYRAHYYMNAPNSQGPNGQGDAAMELYISTEFATGTQICGVNLDAYDFAGLSGQTFKAFECRTVIPGSSPPCPDWSSNGFVAGLIPPPYVNNWANIEQYAFTGGCVAYPAGQDVMAIVQYTPGQNILTTGCPLVAADNGGGLGFGYFYSGVTNQCFGPTFNDWWLMLYGNGPPQPVELAVTLENTKFNSSVDDHPLCGDIVYGNTGLRIFLHLINNLGMIYGPLNLEMWIRGNTVNYSGFTGTGLDMLAGFSSGAKKSPLTIMVPPGSLGGGVNMGPLLGPLFEYSNSAYTFEVLLTDVPFGGTISDLYLEDAQMNPYGWIDDGIAEVGYYVEYPPQWGNRHAKRFDPNEMPSGQFCICYVDHAIWDYSGVTPLLIQAEIRTESTFGPNTPNLCPGGRLGTFNPQIPPCCGLTRANVFDNLGNLGICFTNPPTFNVYATYAFDPGAWGPHATGATTSGHKHKPFGHSGWCLGNAAYNPAWCNVLGEQLPFFSSGSEYIVRLVCQATCPAGGDGGGSVKLATSMPVFAQSK
jgi:hypothetical protein